MRLNYFDYFRAIAIVLIVAVHCITPWYINTLPEMVVGNLIAGGSALFVFISGFFFIMSFIRASGLAASLEKEPQRISALCNSFQLCIFPACYLP